MGWPHVTGNSSANRFSDASDIDASNVGQLVVAWQKEVTLPSIARLHQRSPDSRARASAATGQQCAGCHASSHRFEATPLLIGDALLTSTPWGGAVALDPRTGAVQWRFDPGIDYGRSYPEGLTSRGVAVWQSPANPTGQPCSQRVFVATVDAQLWAVDAESGRACQEFGARGLVVIQRCGGRSAARLGPTSPPAVVGSVVVVTIPGASEPGEVHAYDVASGGRRWCRQLARESVEASRARLSKGEGEPSIPASGNAWSIVTADVERDLLFVPVGNPSPSYFGGGRIGAPDLANAVVALRASTGDLVWFQQLVRHDLWDYDVGTPPLLMDWSVEGRPIPAVVVGTKAGMLFVFDRVTGQPLVPIDERPVPVSDVPGERSSPTQPFPRSDALRFHGGPLTANSMFGLTPADRNECVEGFSALRYEGQFTPPSLRGSLHWPGFAGGVNWDGLAFDPQTRTMLVVVKRLATVATLVRRESMTLATEMEMLGMERAEQTGTPYGALRRPFVASSGVPCSPPPWAEIVALNVDSLTVRWRRPIGAVPWLSSHPEYRSWGSLVFGGALVTGGGVVFIAASQDDKVRALSIASGEVLWEFSLPAGGQASPMTYVVDGRQYVVIAAGGHSGIGSPGNWVVAFSFR
ncbi:MAG TPA: PQQ-binding-like beta-propeller repeat protein [Candidatus Tectomicrobia bacterium]